MTAGRLDHGRARLVAGVIVAVGATVAPPAATAATTSPTCVIVLDRLNDVDVGGVRLTPWNRVAWPVDEPRLDLRSGSLTTVKGVLRAAFAVRDVDAPTFMLAHEYMVAFDVFLPRRPPYHIESIAIWGSVGALPGTDEPYDAAAEAAPPHVVFPRQGMLVARAGDFEFSDAEVRTSIDTRRNVVTIEVAIEDLYAASSPHGLRKSKTAWAPRFGAFHRRAGHPGAAAAMYIDDPELRQWLRQGSDYAIPVDYHSSGQPLNYPYSSSYTIGGKRCPRTNMPKGSDARR